MRQWDLDVAVAGGQHSYHGASSSESLLIGDYYRRLQNRTGPRQTMLDYAVIGKWCLGVAGCYCIRWTWQCRDSVSQPPVGGASARCCDTGGGGGDLRDMCVSSLREGR